MRATRRRAARDPRPVIIVHSEDAAEGAAELVRADIVAGLLIVLHDAQGGGFTVSVLVPPSPVETYDARLRGLARAAAIDIKNSGQFAVGPINVVQPQGGAT